MIVSFICDMYSRGPNSVNFAMVRYFLYCSQICALAFLELIMPMRVELGELENEQRLTLKVS